MTHLSHAASALLGLHALTNSNFESLIPINPCINPISINTVKRTVGLAMALVALWALFV
jgi:hypothetical protein